jgi:hypothetical protein
VSTGTQTLPTVGGALIDVEGENLGLTPAAISLTYSGGSTGFLPRTHTLPPGVCTIVIPGSRLQCPSAPGVGANYTFRVTVDGGASSNSSMLLSYAPPFIGSIDGQGAVLGPAAGGAVVLLHGVRHRPCVAQCLGLLRFCDAG